MWSLQGAFECFDFFASTEKVTDFTSKAVSGIWWQTSWRRVAAASTGGALALLGHRPHPTRLSSISATFQLHAWLCGHLHVGFAPTKVSPKTQPLPGLPDVRPACDCPSRRQGT